MPSCTIRLGPFSTCNIFNLQAKTRAWLFRSFLCNFFFLFRITWSDTYLNRFNANAWNHGIERCFEFLSRKWRTVYWTISKTRVLISKHQRLHMVTTAGPDAAWWRTRLIGCYQNITMTRLRSIVDISLPYHGNIQMLIYSRGWG